LSKHLNRIVSVGGVAINGCHLSKRTSTEYCVPDHGESSLQLEGKHDENSIKRLALSNLSISCSCSFNLQRLLITTATYVIQVRLQNVHGLGRSLLLSSARSQPRCAFSESRRETRLHRFFLSTRMQIHAHAPLKTAEPCVSIQVVDERIVVQIHSIVQNSHQLGREQNMSTSKRAANSNIKILWAKEKAVSS
jgi:hypothetical protein